MIFSRMAGNLSGYFFATMATAAAAFLAIPLLTRLLGLNEFGRYALLEPLQLVLSQAVLAGGNYGIVKQVVYDHIDPVPLTGRIFTGAHLLMVPALGICLAALPRLGFTFVEAILFVLLTYVESYFIILQSAFRASSCVRGFLAGSLIKASLLVVLAVMYLNGAHLSIEVLLGWRVGTVTLGIVAGYLLMTSHVRRSTPKTAWQLPEKKAFHSAVSYGFPILATGLLALVIEFADRYILKAFSDYRTIAFYLIYLKIGACLGPAIITPFNLWWGTERFARLKDPDGGRLFFSRTAVVILIALAGTAGLLWIASPVLISFFAPGVPENPLVVGLLLLSVVAMGMAAPLNIGLLNEGKTHLNIAPAITGAALNIFLCLLLIPRYDISGAAVATLLSYIVYAGLLAFMSQRVYPVPFAYRDMIVYLGAVVTALWLGTSLVSGSALGTMAIKASIFLLLLIPVTLFLLRKSGLIGTGIMTAFKAGGSGR